jgi:hypothetical protein
MIVSSWAVFIFSFTLNHITHYPIITAAIITTLINICILLKLRSKLSIDKVLEWYEVIVLSIIFLLSWFLFNSTFNYDLNSSEIFISRNIWSDYGFHIPLIRSFSFGNNLLLENPIFANEPIRYHFMFNFLVAVLERCGLPLDFALNLPSTLAFSSLVILIYYFSKSLFFQSVLVGILSVVFFLFNSSLAFLEFFSKHSVNFIEQPLQTIWNLNSYSAFGPWDGNIIAVFWNLNIYINQRHLPLAFCVVLVVLTFIIRQNSSILTTKKKNSYIFLGIFSGLLLLWHAQVFLSLLCMLGLIFILFKGRKHIFYFGLSAVIIALPQFLYLQTASDTISSSISLNPGYLVIYHLLPVEYFTGAYLNKIASWIFSFYKYWFYNIGLSLITLSLSFYLVDSKRKKYFIAFLSIFIIGSLFQFSKEMAANHKIFNLWIMLSNCFTAYLLYLLVKKRLIGIIIASFLTIFLTASGILDIMPIKNDYPVIIKDIPKQPIANWVYNNTNKNDIFLTTHRIYNPISLSGRRTMQGWPYFTWGSGYQTDKRAELVRRMYNPETKNEYCRLLIENEIDYVQTELVFNNIPSYQINYTFFETNFEPVFIDNKSSFKEKIYSTKYMCKHID